MLPIAGALGLSNRHVAAGSLLFAGVLVELACVIGLLRSRDAYDALHFTGPASGIGALLICGAVLVNESFSQAGIKAIVVAGVLALSGPLLVHATARAARLREDGSLRLRPEEQRDLERE
jgi:multicomponent Na+:H+ antiporter subunit G